MLGNHKNMRQVALSLDDFSIVNNRLDILKELKNLYPNFKVSLFTVPVDRKEDWGRWLIRKELLEEVKRCLDWIQIIPHGLYHNGSEMRNCDYGEFKFKIFPAIEQAFKDDGLPYVNGFKPPHWRVSNNVVKALDEVGWWMAIDKRQPLMPSTKRFYKYNYGIDEPFWEIDPDKEPVLKLHGHVYGCKNDILRCFNNICKLPITTGWHFVTDFLEEKI